MIYLLEIEGRHYRFIEKKTNYVIWNTNNGPIFPGHLWFLRLVYQPRVMRFNNSSFHSVVKKCIQQDVIICKVRYK